MIRKIKEMLAFLKFRADRINPVEWNEGDRVALEAYLQSDSGKKLLSFMAFESYNQDRQATCQTKDLPWACGCAVGFRIAVAVMTNLSVGGPTPANETKPQSAGERATALRERISP